MRCCVNRLIVSPPVKWCQPTEPRLGRSCSGPYQAAARLLLLWCCAARLWHLHRLTHWFLWGRCVEMHPSVSQQLINKLKNLIDTRCGLSIDCQTDVSLAAAVPSAPPGSTRPLPSQPQTELTPLTLETMERMTTFRLHIYLFQFAPRSTEPPLNKHTDKVNMQTPQEIWHAIKPQQGHFKLHTHSTHTLSPRGIF